MTPYYVSYVCVRQNHEARNVFGSLISRLPDRISEPVIEQLRDSITNAEKKQDSSVEKVIVMGLTPLIG